MLIMIVCMLREMTLMVTARIRKLIEPIQQRAKSISRRFLGTSVTLIFNFRRQPYDAMDIKIIRMKVNSVNVANPTSLFIASFPKTLFSVNMNIEAFMNPSTIENLAGGFSAGGGDLSSKFSFS